MHTANKVYQSRLNLRDFLDLLPDYFQHIGQESNG
ncbi:hypothetical protein SRA_01042 [Streptococcus ratti FA-1 = DSM 20564]|uniref:Transposase n=1 Tax=Streptococcus ratti FA-1 = DSM 20564 TaxID=699248 RepID=A0ABN0GXE5_STRRT|nr:hypothetical protein SRA_01042 [Streptococcus ratti FA-1 = DSM 20564]